MKLFFRRAALAVPLALFLAARFGTAGIRAQSETLVQLTPAVLEISAGSSATLSLEVIGGLDVNAYDVTVRYDPAVIALVSWSHGGYLNNLAQVYKVDEPGLLRLVFTQLATPPISGDGVLLDLVFQGTAPGTSAVTIEQLDFAGAEGSLYNPQLLDGTVTVTLSAATALPTAALTSTPSSTAVIPGATLAPPANTPVSAATRGVSAIATPDLSRTAPVSGSATPTRQPILSTPASAATADSFAANPPPGKASAVVPTLAPPPAAEMTDPNSYRWLNLALWAGLALLLIAFVWMLVLAFRRPKSQFSDKE